MLRPAADQDSESSAAPHRRSGQQVLYPTAGPGSRPRLKSSLPFCRELPRLPNLALRKRRGREGGVSSYLTRTQNRAERVLEPHKPAIPELLKLRQGDQELEITLGYAVKPGLKTQKEARRYRGVGVRE